MSRKSLWDFYDGEPFMENPHLAIVGVNPKSRKKGKTMAARKRRTTRRRSRKAAPRRKARRTARRNFPTAGLAFNPRKRRRGRKATSRRRTRRHSMRRNPAILGVTLPPITMLAWGAGGFIATPMVEGFISKFVPPSITGNTLGRYAMKIASALGLTWLTKTVMGNKEAFPVALGGSLYVIVSAVNEFVPQLTQLPKPATGIPAPGTNAYRSGMVKAYRGGMISTGVGAYTPGRMLNGSLPNLAGALPGLAQPSTMMNPFNLAISGMTNPVFADPRFTSNATVPR